MVWYWAGPDFLPANPADHGFLFGKGALDFAGGTVVHINAGIAGLVGCLVLGKRIGYKTELDPAALAADDLYRRLVCCGSAGSASTPAPTSKPMASTAVAFINTFVATAAAALAWAIARAGRAQEAVAARCGDGRCRWPGGDHSGVGLRALR